MNEKSKTRSIRTGLSGSTAAGWLLAGVGALALAILLATGPMVSVAKAQTEQRRCLLRTETATTEAGGTVASTFVTACGRLSEATATQAALFGDFARAQGERSTAIGANAFASANFSTAVGNFATATQLDSAAYGSGSGATGTRSSAYGAGSRAMNGDSTALGAFSTAAGFRSVAIGQNASANWDGVNPTFQDAIAIGNNAAAPGNISIAIGADARADGGGIDRPQFRRGFYGRQQYRDRARSRADRGR